MLYSSMMPRPLTNFLHCFTLKQGTILIGILHLFASGIATTICILALTHAIDIREMVARDTEDAMDRGVFEDDNSMRLNMKRMKLADCNAQGMVDEMWIYLLFWIIHFMSTAFMLAGLSMNYRRPLSAWIIMNIAEFVLMISSLITNRDKLKSVKCVDAIIFAAVGIINLWSTYTVWSTFLTLKKKKGLIHEIHQRVLKKKPIQTAPPECSGCSTSSPRLAKKPYEV